MRLLKTFLFLGSMLLLFSCGDDDSFTTSRGNLLTFSTDTVSLDTVFSNVPTATKTLWVYNRSGDGLRCTNIRLDHGNQTGFRVNVDGTYLGATNGYQTNEVEVRNKDSIRVFVELTSTMAYDDTPQLIEDDLVFTLECGVQQRVNLNAYTWDALQYNDVHIKKDSVLVSQKPIIIYGGLVVDSFATLTIGAGTTLYFHNDAGIDVYGRLVCDGSPDANVILRGDRIDKMFDYLPYDNVSGQWTGIYFYESSYDNVINYTDIHGTYDGIIIDSCDVERNTLSLVSSTVHNCQGYGVWANCCQVQIMNSQITNTLYDCLFVNGGKVTVNNTTLAQFYPFDSNRGVALRFSAREFPLDEFSCLNTLITGFANDEMMGEPNDSLAFNYHFGHCIIRTPTIKTEDSVNFEHVVFEDIEDTTMYGRKHFVLVDHGKQKYDFHLDSISSAIDKADAASSLPLDREGNMRDEMPDVGCFERIKNKP